MTNQILLHVAVELVLRSFGQIVFSLSTRFNIFLLHKINANTDAKLKTKYAKSSMETVGPATLNGIKPCRCVHK
jgi:hypothetical protein